MEMEGIQCFVELWSLNDADVKTSFDTSEVTAGFQANLEKELTDRGLSISEGAIDSSIIVKGKFVCIDEGNRFLRWLIFGIFGGRAIVEVTGELISNGKVLEHLHARNFEDSGLFGGNSMGMLKRCAKRCAKKVAKQVISSLK